MPPTAAADRQWKPLLILAVIVFLCHAAITGGHLTSPDEELLYRMSESMALRGTTAILPIEADLRTGIVPVPQTFATRLGIDGESYYAQYLPLQPLLAVPLVWLAVATEGAFAESFVLGLQPTAMLASLVELPTEDFQRYAYRRGIVALFFNPLVSAATAVVLAQIGFLLCGRLSGGILLAVLYSFGTIGWAHAKTFFTEPLAGLFAVLALHQLIRFALREDGNSLRHATLLGLFLGLGNLTRVDGPFFTVGFLAAAALVSFLRLRESKDSAIPWLPLVVMAIIPAAAWLTLQSLNASRYGVDLTSGYSQQSEGVKFSTPLLVGLHGLVMSPGKGLLFFSPALLIGLYGWTRTPSQWHWLRICTLLAYLPFTIAMAKWQNWDGGWCWGPRHIVQIHLPIMLGAAFLFTEPLTRMLKIAITAVMLVAVPVQLYGASQTSMDFYRIFFVRFDDVHYYRLNLNPLQTSFIDREFSITRREDRSSVPPNAFPASMLDSLYLPQHTQWYGYRLMWSMGHCDLYIINRLTRPGTADWNDIP